MDINEALIGESTFIRKLRKDIPKLAKLQSHILLRGERGTGRKFIAQLIHELSDTKNLVILNPSIVSSEELRELLSNIGSSSSTILVQEAEEFSFVDQKCISDTIKGLPKKPFSRFIVTAKKSLAELERDQKLLGDFRTTLDDFEAIEVPSINRRREDIPPLVEHFIQNACKNAGLEMKTIDINALDFVSRRTWDDNIRELKAVIERGVLTSEGKNIELPHELVDEYQQLEGMIEKIDDLRGFSFDKSLSNLEKTLIERTLEAVSFSQTRTAQILGVSEANLRYRMKKFHIAPEKK